MFRIIGDNTCHVNIDLVDSTKVESILVNQSNNWLISQPVRPTFEQSASSSGPRVQESHPVTPISNSWNVNPSHDCSRQNVTSTNILV